MQISKLHVENSITESVKVSSSTQALITMISLHSPSKVQPKDQSEDYQKRQDEHCFCHLTSPVFNLASLIGLNIITSKHSFPKRTFPGEKGDQPPNKSTCITYCHSTSPFSLASITNAAFFLAYFYFTLWIYQHLGEHLGLFFTGVDFYTLAVDVVANFGQATFLLLYARIKGKRLLQVLHEVQSIFEEMKIEGVICKLPVHLKTLSIGLVIFIIASTATYGVLFLYLVFAMSFPYMSISKRQDLLTVSFVSEKIGHFLMPLYSQVLVALFIVVTAVIRQLFINLAEKLADILSVKTGMLTKVYVGQPNSPEKCYRGDARSVSDEVEACRLIYRKLYRTVGTVSLYFGGSLLVICCTSVLSMTVSIYTIILKKAGPRMQVNMVAGEQEQQKDIIMFYFVIWFFHLFFTFFSLGGILISGQRLTYASQLMSKTIQEATFNGRDKDLQFQVEASCYSKL